jgi:type IV secretory pathway VirB4 component
MADKKGATPTQQFIDLKSIDRNTVILKSGSLRKVLLVSGTNFSLKSEEEQGLITYAFQGFLNSLDFSVQIFIHSRKLNIEDYLKKLEEREAQEENALLRNQISEYREFIKSIVAQNAIMQKRFFVVVPYDPVQLPQAGLGVADTLLGAFRRGSKKTETEKREEAFDANLQQLDQRVDQVVAGLNQVGLRVVPLDNEELIELFYNLYNPATVEKRVDLQLSET